MPSALEPIDLAKIADRYGRKWVALTFDMQNVLASGNSVEEVEQKLISKDISPCNVIITKPPHPDACLII